MNQGELADPTIKLLKTTNKLLAEAQQFNAESLVCIRRIPTAKMRMLVVADASFKNLRGGGSQGGYALIITDDQGQTEPNTTTERNGVPLVPPFCGCISTITNTIGLMDIVALVD